MTWEQLTKEFNNSKAQRKGLKLPRQNTQKGEVLLFYWQNKGKILLKKDIEKVVCERMGIPSKDLQECRHLAKQNGFNILQEGAQYNGKKLKGGEYVFISFDTVNEYWSVKRRDESDLDFSKLKKKFNNTCATCGAKEGRQHRYTNQAVKLEKGHMDPTLPMTKDNIIPQCSHCNKVYKDNFVFGLTGFVKKPTVEGVKNTLNNKEKKKLYLQLKKEFENV